MEGQLLELNYGRQVWQRKKRTFLKVFFHQKLYLQTFSKMNFTDFFTSLHIYWHVRGLSIRPKNLSYYYYFLSPNLWSWTLGVLEKITFLIIFRLIGAQAKISPEIWWKFLQRQKVVVIMFVSGIHINFFFSYTFTMTEHSEELDALKRIPKGFFMAE